MPGLQDLDIKLSNRMKTIVDMVDEDSVCDIGCDHAFVSIALICAGRSHRVIAMDVRQGPVGIAQANVRVRHMEDRIDVRLSDGFGELAEGEAECAIIAGMGGPLMVRILRNGAVHTDRGIHLVLQPQSEPDAVRAYLYGIRYDIVEERMLFEEGKYYTAMKAVPARQAIRPYSRPELLYGRYLLEKKDMILQQYIRWKLRKNQELVEELKHIHTDRACGRQEELLCECRMLSQILNDFD